jgi:cystathionine beta-lyase/cystathionine gamma-synthase
MQLWSDRTFTGGVPGSLDAWLLLRSLRTLNIRIQRQSKTATALAQWLNSLTAEEYVNSGEKEGNGTKGIVRKVFHTSLQEDAKDLVAEDGSKQMTMGPACFGVLLEKEIYAEYLGSRLQLFFVRPYLLIHLITMHLQFRRPTECDFARRSRKSDRAAKSF